MATAKKTTNNVLVCEFEFKKATAGAVAYAQDAPADGSRPEIGSIYLTKAAGVKYGIGRRIRVTVEALD